MPLPRLTWVLCDQAGAPLPGGHVATNRRLVAARNRSMEARLSLSLHDQAAVSLFAALQNGIPQLRVYLGTGNDAEIVFSGHWTPMQGSNSVDSPSTLNLVFKDAFSRLAYRFSDLLTFTQIDAGVIAYGLLEDAHEPQGLIDPVSGFSGVAIDLAWIEPTKLRDRTYSEKNVAEAITELTEVIEGFDWFPVYLDSQTSTGGTTMEFHVAARVGSDQPTAIFEYGEGTKQNLQGYSFTTGLPVTFARVVGGDGSSQEQRDVEAARKYNVYMSWKGDPDVTDPATMAEKAYAELRPSPAHVTEFQPDPTLSPLPWRDFWIGDTIRLNIDDGAMQQESVLRVQSIEVGVDDSDNISDLVVGIDPLGSSKYLAPANSTRRYVAQQQDILRRLNALER